MLLTLDVGNTNITLGVFEGDSLVLQSRVATEHHRMPDQYAVEFLDIFKLHGIDCSSFEGAVISSVVPSLDRTILQAVSFITGTQPLMVGPGTKTGVNIRIDNPAQLGADLLVGAVAAIDKYGTPCVIIDLGTATTISVISKEREFLGGAIVPGVNTSYDSLVSRSSLLPSIHMTAPGRVVGSNTIECMQSGAIWGTACLLDGMCDRIEEELGYPLPVVATGGLGQEIIRHCRREIVYDGTLLLTGLRLVYEKNRK